MGLVNRVFGGDDDSPTTYQCSACPETFEVPDGGRVQCPVCGDRNASPL
ncbi:hypothetical protein [Halomarina ordinaria]|uniref:Rubrerythrin-like domain-containing protein n=1 Tax=Halomarina ordinaria TaxID=3033939 RepID=A0ABD5U8D9_9EURY|nr:hypothetical protein [Halomarina sp. PSRA2]